MKNNIISITGNFSPSLAEEARDLVEKMSQSAPYGVLPVGKEGRLYVVRDRTLLLLEFAAITTQRGVVYIGVLKR